MVYQFLIVIDGNKVTIWVLDLAPSWGEVGDDLFKGRAQYDGSMEADQSIKAFLRNLLNNYYIHL
jgi:hypothetical protein